MQVGPKAALYLTALGVSATFISCFQYFGMVRTSRNMRVYLEAPPGVKVKKISKEMVWSAEGGGSEMRRVRSCRS